MNIFVLDYDVNKCAQYHLDKHCVKMILETTQLLNNALIKHDSLYSPVYRETHKNHPCSLWAAESIDNFEWLVKLGLALSNEYTFRYNKIHKCHDILKELQQSISLDKFPKVGMTPFRKCMPEQYKCEDAVDSYRKYYKYDKSYIAKWSKREVPEWWNNVN